MKSVKKCFLCILGMLLCLTDLYVLPVNAIENDIADEIVGSALEETDVFTNINEFGATTKGALPCIGEPKILVFYTTFTNGDPAWELDKAGVENMFFGEEKSLRRYYYDSSYGKVNIQGTVYEYQTQYDTSYYSDAYFVLEEIVDYYGDSINWDDYDYNNDGYIDGIYIVTKTSHSWGGPNYVTNCSKNVGTKEISKYAFINSSDLHTLAHETCHMFGPPDIYAGVTLNPDGTKSDTIMDMNGWCGDLPGIIKFVFGWIDQTHFISGNGTITLDIDSYSKNGELIVVHPNGDKNNENWFVIEYLTKEVNNYYNGVRIWKTNMNLDTEFNVNNSKNDTGGMLDSPYDYLVSMYSNDEGNYYYTAGEKLTPYTTPSTSYGKTYKVVGSSKVVEESGFSGISIEIEDINPQSATITIDINNATDDNPISASMTFYPHNGQFISNSNKVQMGCLSSKTEMKIVDDVVITNQQNEIIPVITEFNQDFTEIYFYVDKADFSKLKVNENYQLNVLEAIQAYYGGAINIPGFSPTFTLDKKVVPMNMSSEFYYEIAYLDDPLGYLNYHFVNNQISFITYNNNQLVLHHLDEENNKVSDIYLENPIENKQNYTFLQTSLFDGQYYLVVFANYSTGHKWFLAYDSKGSLVDQLYYDKPHSQMMSNGQYIFEEYGRNVCCDFVFENNGIVKKEITSGIYTLYQMIDQFYYIEKTNEDNQAIYYVKNRNGNTVGTHSISSNDELFGFSLNNQYYIVEIGKNIHITVYNNDFEMLESKEILKDANLSITTSMQFQSYEHGYWLALETVPADNYMNYQSTIILTLDEELNLKSYYRYGDTSFRFCGDVVLLDNGMYLIGEPSKYTLIKDPSCPVKPEINVDVENELVKVEDDTTTKLETSIKTIVDSILKNEDVNGVNSETIEVILSAMENMKDIKVNSTLLSDKISVSNIDESIIATIKETAGEGNIAEYFAFVIGLDVYVDEVLVQVDQLTKLQEPITLTIEIPEGLPEVSKGMTRIYSMIRVHDGVTEKIPTTLNADGTISFKTDRFSIYALAYEDVDYICGDINNDGKVNSFDRNILARYIANWDGYDINNYNAAAADVNLDGKVNSFDRNILARHIAAWDGYETLPYK